MSETEERTASSKRLIEAGHAHQRRGALSEALDAYREALDLDPSQVSGWYAAGCAENGRERFVAAMACFRRALALAPDWAEAQHNLAKALFALGQVDEALTFFRRATNGSRPELPVAMIAVVIPGSPRSDNQAVLDARRTYTDRALPAPRGPARPISQTGPLCIGYVSAFFHRENYMKPVWGLINAHDRREVNVHLFGDGPSPGTWLGYRPHADDRVHDSTNLPADAVADRVAAAGIDLLIDLNGYSAMRRLPVFALRPAPVNVGWFNMFATTGAACYDWLIGDDVVIPREEERCYRERIARVPGSYLTFDVAYDVPPVVDPPCRAARADEGVRFGCFAPQYKITPQVIEVWCRILHGAPTSTLTLKNRCMAAGDDRQFVLDQFAQHGIAPDRLRLEGPADHFQFLRAYDGIDVALDTFPYNGGTTTTEAIWQGVPVISFTGDRWVARTSASILRAGGLGDFVGRDLDAYVRMAIDLAHAPDVAERLTDLRHGMRDRLRAAPVCDTVGFAREMERLYRMMAAR